MTDKTSKKLREETERWLEKIKSKDIKAVDDENAETFAKNIQAYTDDAEHFLEEGKLVEAFEAVIWAWSWLEIGEELGVLE